MSIIINTNMSDTGRKPFTDKISETIKPESQKTYVEQGKEVVTDALDGVAAKATPNSQKGFGQAVADSAKQGHTDAKTAVQDTKAEAEHGEHTLAETAQEYFEAAKEQAAHAAEYVSAVVTGATEGAHKGASVAETEVKK